MKDISNFISTKKKVISKAVLKTNHVDLISLISDEKLIGNDILEQAKAAGLLAIKRTADFIPNCHFSNIDFVKIEFQVQQTEIQIRLEVTAVSKASIDTHAIFGCNVAATTLYESLKQWTHNISIENINIQLQKGEVAQFCDKLNEDLKSAVIVCSDSISQGKKEDKGGKIICERLKNYDIVNPLYQIVPDEKNEIQSVLKKLVADQYQLIIFTGGTGLSPRDVTPQAVKELLDIEIPGMMEAARNFGQQRTPFAMLSRGVAGFINNSLVITLPGSSKGVEETLDAIFPFVKHVFKIATGMRHD